MDCRDAVFLAGTRYGNSQSITDPFPDELRDAYESLRWTSVLCLNLGVQRANLVPLLNELAERDLIERRPAPNDKRAYALHVTAAGECILEEALACIHDHEERLLHRLSADERETLKRLLAKITGDNL